MAGESQVSLESFLFLMGSKLAPGAFSWPPRISDRVAPLAFGMFWLFFPRPFCAIVKYADWPKCAGAWPAGLSPPRAAPQREEERSPLRQLNQIYFVSPLFFFCRHSTGTRAVRPLAGGERLETQVLMNQRVKLTTTPGNLNGTPARDACSAPPL